MTKHTPGPWEVCGGLTPKYSAIKSNDGYIIFKMADYQSDKENGKKIKAPDYEIQRFNLELMAAAPWLLDALKELLGHCCGPTCSEGKYDDGYQLARAEALEAIARAEGGQ